MTVQAWRGWPPEGQTLCQQRHPPRPTEQVTALLGYSTSGRVHLHSQTVPTSGSSWSATCSKPSDTSTPVDAFGPGSVCAMTWSTSPLATARSTRARAAAVPNPLTPELRGDFVADLDSAVDRRGGEAT